MMGCIGGAIILLMCIAYPPLGFVLFIICMLVFLAKSFK